jgi:hypothetical protein
MKLNHELIASLPVPDPVLAGSAVALLALAFLLGFLTRGLYA